MILQSRSTPPILSFLCCIVNIFLINKNDHTKRRAFIRRVEQGSLLSGLFVGLEAGRKLPLTGFRSGLDLMSFVVNFGSNGPHHFAWAGQHAVERVTEKIITQWHMTIDVPDEDGLKVDNGWS